MNGFGVVGQRHRFGLMDMGPFSERRRISMFPPFCVRKNRLPASLLTISLNGDNRYVPQCTCR
jgi:hypothetical protein